MMRILACLVPLVLALSLPPGRAAVAEGQTWTFECVDCPKQFGITERSLQLDAAGHPHVAYGDDHLYYAWHDGLNWQQVVVDPAPGVGHEASLVLDAAGRPHIAYGETMPADTGGITYTPRYAYRDAAGWHVEAVDVAANVPSNTALAVDSQGRPHLAYFDRNYSEVRYASRDALGWHVEVVERPPYSLGSFPAISLALDGAGRAHASYTLGGLKYAYRDAAGWHVESVPGAEDAGNTTSLALDGAGWPHIAYATVTYAGLGVEHAACHAYRDAKGWHVETIAAIGSINLASSLGVDGAGRVHVSYYDSYDALHTTFKYALRDGAGWHVETLDDSTQFAGYRSSLAVDTAGVAHIAYTVGYFHDLYYSSYGAGGWHPELVDRSGYLGAESSLALDGSSQPHVTYLDIAHATVRYAYRDGNGWHQEVVDSVGDDSTDVRGNTSLVLDAEGLPHVTGPATDERAIEYAYRDGAGWHVETVAGGSEDPSGYSTLVLDGDGQPHVGYYAADGLKYASRDASGWHAETVSAWSPYDEPPALALDGQGYAHVVYSGHGSLEIEHVYQDASGWHFEGLPTGDHVLSATPLALDADGFIHVAYLAGMPGYFILWYGHQDESGWHTGRVPGGSPVYGFSLAVDAAGRPHLACSRGDDLLTYFYQDPSGWHLEMGEGPNGVDYPLSLVLDGRGDPRVVFRMDGGDVGYAHGHFYPDLSSSAKVGRPGIGAGERLAYTLHVVNSGREPVQFALTDPIPALTTYVPGSLWASEGTTADLGGISWTGSITGFGHLTATFAVTVEGTLTRPVTIANVATLAGDPLGPVALEARNVVNGVGLYLPLVRKNK